MPLPSGNTVILRKEKVIEVTYLNQAVRWDPTILNSGMVQHYYNAPPNGVPLSESK